MRKQDGNDPLIDASFDEDADMPEVEELDFHGSARPPRKRRPHGAALTAFVAVLATLLVLACAGGAWYLWQTRWREVTFTVDNEPVAARASTTVATLLKDHGDFGRTRGRLVSVNGNVLDDDGGNPVSVKLDGKPLDAADYATTTVANVSSMTVTPGTDRMEEYTVEQRTLPFDTDINLNNGPIQEVTQQGKDGLSEVWVGKESGEELTMREITPMEALVVESFAPAAPDGRKAIALTFDDGPSQYTGKVLDVLKEKKVKATFFDLGEQALLYPQLEQRMVAEGHQVASHTESHQYLPNLDRDALRQDIEQSLADLKEASGTVTRTIRAPYGAFGVQQWKDTADLIDRNVLWTIDTLDWEQPGAKAIREEVAKHAYNGAVVLMHDGGGDRTQTIEALPGIIDDLRKQGYEFVTIDQLCTMGGLPDPAQPSEG